MARPPSQTDFLSSPNASYHCHLEASRTHLYHIFLPQLRLDHWRQRNRLDLADHHLQIHTVQPRYVHPI